MQNAATADELMRSLAREGYDPHAVRDEDGLLKIRVGRFARRADAERVRREICTVVTLRQAQNRESTSVTPIRYERL